MLDYGLSLSWMVIAPCALITDILAIVVIAHYFPFFHGTDVTLLSLLCAMAGNALVVLPIPAYLGLREIHWTPTLCTAYVWCCLTLRLSQTLSLTVMSVHWSTLLKMSAEKKKYFSTKFLKITIVFVWLVSAIFGLLPVIGAASDKFNENNNCRFLAFNLGTGFALFFVIVNFATMFVSIICACDATFLIKHMKAVAKTKYQAGRFHIPDTPSEIPGPGPVFLIERYHRLNFAWDLSKFALIFIVLSFTINHFPYVVIQGIQLFSSIDDGTLEVIVLYLVGAEALLLPHAIWLLSRRYKHALMYQWKVHALRRKTDVEEDPYSCTLQSYTQRERDRVSVGPSRPSSRAGNSISGTVRSTKSDVLGNIHINTNGRTPIAAIANDISTLELTKHTHEPVNGIIMGEIHVENHIYNERGIETENLELAHNVSRNATPFATQDLSRRESEASSSTTSQSSNKGTHLSPTPHTDVQRSVSNASRKDWKEQMRKKHLPSIFINEGFDAEDNRAAAKLKQESAATLYKGNTGNASAGSLHFYMSSDYHPDYLTETLPRKKMQQTLSQESEGGEAYQDSDINDVLDNDINATHSDSVIENERDEIILRKTNSFGNHKSDYKPPYLSSFKSDPNSHHDFESRDSKPVQSVYSTFHDLSMSGMKSEQEITFDPGSILVENDDDYNAYQIQSDLNRITYDTSSKDSPYHGTPSHDKEVKDFTQPFSYGVNNIEMASTSFGKIARSEDQKINRFSTFTLPSYYKGDSGIKTYQKQPTSSSSTPYVSNNINNSTDYTVEEKNRSVSIDDENASSESSGSVTISPYKAEKRHRPWMVDVGNNDDEILQMSEPLVEESDTDTLKESQDSNEFRFNASFDGKHHSHSELSTPVSSIFDEETDRGFEEALEMHATSAPSVYGGVGLCFESIKEEPEDLTSSGSNPFLDNVSNADEEFRTQAVISRSSRSDDSMGSSNTSINENPFSSSPIPTRKNGIDFKTHVHILHNDDAFEFADSGFTSGMERGNVSDSSSQQDATCRGKISPWPDHDENIADNEQAFESNFNTAHDFSQPENNISKFESGLFLKNNSDIKIKTEYGVRNQPFSFPKQNVDNTLLEARRPLHKTIQDIKSNKRKAPVRVKSLDGASPLVSRKLVKRGSSFEFAPTNVKPAYF